MGLTRHQVTIQLEKIVGGWWVRLSARHSMAFFAAFKFDWWITYLSHNNGHINTTRGIPPCLIILNSIKNVQKNGAIVKMDHRSNASANCWLLILKYPNSRLTFNEMNNCIHHFLLNSPWLWLEGSLDLNKKLKTDKHTNQHNVLLLVWIYCVLTTSYSWRCLITLNITNMRKWMCDFDNNVFTH